VKDLITRKISNNGVKGLPILVIIVGESGSGKTTFVKMMDCDENWFESSRAMVKKLLERGEPVTHDSIHSLANKAYKENPCWQVPNIIRALDGKKFLLFDGPRRIEEVKAVIAIHPRVLVIRIAISSNELRFNRLQKRDEIGQEDFYRLLIHEAGETELMQIVSLADFTIFNNSSLEDIKKQADELKEMLLSIDNF
jgi:dephospho-CoA kinase